MKQRLRRLLQKRTPVVIRVLVSEFGALTVLRSTTLLLAGLALLVATCVLAGQISPLLTIGLIGLVCLTLLPLKPMELVGQVLCAAGIIRENLSRRQQAKRLFRAASRFLADPHKAYLGLSRITETDEELREFTRWMQVRNSRPSQKTALLMGRCWRETGDFEAARVAFEKADKLGSSDSVKLELATMYLLTGAARSCLEMLEGLARPDDNGQCFFLRASALRCLGRFDDALQAVNRSTQIRPCDPEYHVEKGRILEALGRLPAARKQYSKALRVDRRHAEARCRRAEISLQMQDAATAVQDLEKCYQFDNTRVDAYLRANRIKAGGKSPIISLSQSPKAPCLSVQPEEFEVVKGQTTSIQICITTDVELQDCCLAVLEPFGWGVEVSPRQVSVGRVSPGTESYVKIQVKAKRASEVNLNQAWVLNVVLTAGNSWASKLVRVNVTDPEEGKIFLVLTNDHEPRLHRQRLRSGNKCPIFPEETQADLVDKAQRANALAEKYSFIWTYFLDAGAALGLLRWAGDLSHSWEKVRTSVEDFYHRACSAGHDWQLHLHLAGLPESYFFCYGHDPIEDVVSFDVAKKEAYFPTWGINSWANVVRRYGKAGKVNTRVGSLALASHSVSSLLEKARGDAPRLVLFRAGQWDLGSNTAEREKSIMALRECAFLADSSISEGYNCYTRPFRFGAPAGRTSYFTFRNNPEKPARRLVDAGVLEVVPFLLPNGAAITPQDDPRAVIEAYRRFSLGNRIAAGRHILMEIEHLSTIPNENGKVNKAWQAMDRHLAAVRCQCPNLEGIKAQDAVYAWLDYYSPEPLVRLGRPRLTTRGDRNGLIFPLDFLGDGILGQTPRRYQTNVPLPALNPGWSGRIRILEGDKEVLETSDHNGSQVLVELELSEDNRQAFALELELARSKNHTVEARALAQIT